MKQRCNPGTPCHANLIGKTFEGIFDLVPPTVVPNDLDPSGFDWKLRVTIGYPYKVRQSFPHSLPHVLRSERSCYALVWMT